MSRKAIWKYPLTSSMVSVSMPVNSEILTVAWQHGNPTLWAKIDPGEAKMVYREFAVIATGQPFYEDTFSSYVGTCFDPDGFVWHILEAVAKEVS